MTKMLRSVALACLLVLAACGDADTNDERGYTKAPLENPGWTVDSEEPSAMAELGEPIRIPSLDTMAVDTAAAATAATNPQPAPAPTTPAPNPQPTSSPTGTTP